MNIQQATRRDVYYTHDHEWIDFQGNVAYTGVCSFKLIGFRQIHRIQFFGQPGFRKKGDIIAQISYNDYRIEAHMPVDGKIIGINEELLSGDQNKLIQTAESGGWLFKLIPAQPSNKEDLLLPKQYQQFSRSRYAQ